MPLEEAYRLVSDSQRRCIVFENGLTAMIQRNDSSPVAAVRVYVRAGSAFEGQWAGSGITHLLEHVITCDGTERRSETELLSLGDAVGGLVNAYTTVDQMCHHALVPKEHMAVAVEMFADYLVCPLLSERVFRRERGVIQRELERDREDPETRLAELLQETAYRGHPLQYAVIGHRERFLRLKHEDLLAYHKLVNTAENALAVVVGDVDVDETAAIVADAFVNLQRGPARALDLPEIAAPAAPVQAIRRMDVASTSMALAWLSVREGDADDVALDLLCSVLGDGDQARLVKALRWDRQLVLDLSGVHDTCWHTPGLVQISAQCLPSNLDAVRAAVVGIVDALETKPVTQSELERAKAQHLTSLQYQRESAEGLASQLGDDLLAFGSPDYAAAFEQRVKAATVDDLMRAARRILIARAPILAAVAPKDTASAGLAAKSASSAEAIESTVLENGLTCIVRSMPASAFAAVQICFRGGLVAEDSETNGTFNLLAQALVRGGGGRNAEQIAEAFALRGSGLQSATGLNLFGCGFTSLAADFEALLEVAADVVIKPALHQDEIDKIKPAIHDAINRVDEDLHGELMRFARSRFFQASPYRRIQLGTPANIERFATDDLKRIHGAFAAGANGVIAVAGRVKPNDALQTIARLFRGLNRGVRFTPAPISERHGEQDRFFVKRNAIEREAAALFVGFRGLSFSDMDSRAAVTLIETMLAGFSLSSGRLYAALRGGGQDLVYDVAANGMTGLLPGYIAFTAACQPQRIAEVYHVMRGEIDAIRRGDFDDAEMDRARNMILAGELEQLQSPGDFAARIALDELFGLGAEDWRHFLEQIRSVDRRAVLDAAERFLTHATVAIITPNPDDVSLDCVAPRHRD